MREIWAKGSAAAALLAAALAAGAAHAQATAPTNPAAPVVPASPTVPAAPVIPASPTAPETPAASDAAPGAGGATAKPKAAKPKPKGPPSIDVVVTNKRTVGLVELDATISGADQPKKIAGPLGQGKKVVAHIAHDKACLFDLHGSYADGSTTDVSSVELCKEKKINLVD